MNLEYIEEELGKSTWFAGEELTGAGAILHMLRRFATDVSRYHDEFSDTACTSKSRYAVDTVTSTA